MYRSIGKVESQSTAVLNIEVFRRNLIQIRILSLKSKFVQNLIVRSTVLEFAIHFKGKVTLYNEYNVNVNFFYLKC